MNKIEAERKIRNLKRAKKNNNDETKTITRKQLLSTGGTSFQGFIVFAKEIKSNDTFKGFSMTVCITKFLNEFENEKTITISIEEKKSADKDEVEEWKRKLSANGKTPPKGGNIKYIPNGKIHERTIKIYDLIELNMWSQNKEDFPILPTEVKDFDLLNFINFTVDIRNEKNNILEYNNLGDFSLVGSGPKQFFEFINNIDLKTEITNVKQFIKNNLIQVNDVLSQGRPTFFDLKNIIGNEINRLFFFNTSKKYLDGTLDDYLSDDIIIFNSKRRVNIGLLKQNSDNTKYSIPISIIYDQPNIKDLQHTIQFELWKSQLLIIGINTYLFEKNYIKIMNNLDIIIEGKISKDSLIANKHLIDKEEAGNCIITYVQKLVPIYSSLFSSIGLQINFEIVKYIIKHYFGTINFSTSKEDKKKKISKVLELANINELNKKKNGVYSLLEYDQNLNQFNNDKYFFFIIDDNNHTKANYVLNEKFQSEYGDNDKKFDQILKHFKDGKSAFIQFDMVDTNRDKDALDFSIFAIEKEIYESWIDIDKKNKKGSEELKSVLEDTDINDFDENKDYSKLPMDIDNNDKENDNSDSGDDNSGSHGSSDDNEVDIKKPKTNLKPKLNITKKSTTSKTTTPKKSTQQVLIKPKMNTNKRSIDPKIETSDKKKSRRK